MKQVDLEKKLKLMVDAVQSTGLISCCKCVAQLGSGNSMGRFSHYSYSDCVVAVKYDRDEEYVDICVVAGGVSVFNVHRIQREAESSPINPVLRDGDVMFELCTYIPGSWEEHIRSLYVKANVDVPKNVLEYVAARFGIRE